MTAEQRISRWSRRFVAASSWWLVLALAAVVVDERHRTTVVLLVFGFVLHVLFGKAYALVPTYFDRQLASSWAPVFQFPFAVIGTAGLAVGGSGLTDGPLAARIGAVAWSIAVVIFLTTLLWTIRDNLSGSETATGDASADRRGVDRLANAFVPLVFVYLAAGTYATLASATQLPVLIDGYPPRATHLLAAGTGGLLVFAVGFRLLPRFLVASPPKPLVPVVLVSGALGPILIAAGLPTGPLLHAGAGLEAIAVVAFAVSYVTLFVRSARTRIGFYGVLAGVLFGVLGVALGLLLASGTRTAAVLTAHFRTNLVGFLGATIIGVSYQFYPPGVGSFRGASDRTAAGIVGLLSIGLLIQIASLLLGIEPGVLFGELLVLSAALAHALLLSGLFVDRY